MLLKDLPNGSQFRFASDISEIVYTIEGDKLTWTSPGSIVVSSLSKCTWFNREVNMVTFDTITALQKMKEGKKVRRESWSDKNDYIYLKEDLIVDWSGFAYSIGGMWTDWIEFVIEKKVTIKLNSEYSAEVTRDKITVGCQTFTHEVLKQLVKASEEVNRG